MVFIKPCMDDNCETTSYFDCLFCEYFSPQCELTIIVKEIVERVKALENK